MLTRSLSAIVLACLLLVPATAQTVRFDTNVGTFDLELNPTGNPNLQGHVDNILAYVDSGRYDLTVINRAAEGFVMQMGGFQLTDSLELPASFNAFPSVISDAPVIVDADNDGTVDFDVSGLLNTRGTVSLALSSSANTGTSSFFVNLGTNPSLDAANLRFVPFANVVDMATIDLIMGLPQTDYAQGSLAGDDVPTLDENRAVFVERAFVVEADEMGPMDVAEMLESMDEGSAEALSLDASGGSASSGPTGALQSFAVPEPPALVLALGALVAIYIMKPNKLR